MSLPLNILIGELVNWWIIARNDHSPFEISVSAELFREKFVTKWIKKRFWQNDSKAPETLAILAHGFQGIRRSSSIIFNLL